MKGFVLAVILCCTFTAVSNATDFSDMGNNFKPMLPSPADLMNSAPVIAAIQFSSIMKLMDKSDLPLPERVKHAYSLIKAASDYEHKFLNNIVRRDRFNQRKREFDQIMDRAKSLISSYEQQVTEKSQL
jgi:hypothetical protein